MLLLLFWADAGGVYVVTFEQSRANCFHTASSLNVLILKNKKRQISVFLCKFIDNDKKERKKQTKKKKTVPYL